MFSVLPPLGRTMGLTEWQVGTVFALSGFLWFLMSPYWGRKSDVWGRKPVVLLGVAAYGVRCRSSSWRSRRTSPAGCL